MLIIYEMLWMEAEKIVTQHSEALIKQTTMNSNWMKHLDSAPILAFRFLTILV